MAKKTRRRSECELCHGRWWLTQLQRLQVFDFQGRTPVFDEILCTNCAFYIREYYAGIDASYEAFYHPA